MKIKITCRPRYNPWLKKYLNTKTFSKILAFGILLNSVPVNSFAEILSENDRYEVFEGSSITISNVLEEAKVDVEIEGNTLVNLQNNSEGWVVQSSGTTINNKATILKKLKPSTEYTVIIYDSNPIVKLKRMYLTGVFKSGLINVITTPSDLTNANKFLHVYTDEPVDNKYMSNVKAVVIEGDWTNKELPPYFEGIKSVGQNDNDGHSIEILSQNKNLFNGFTERGNLIGNPPNASLGNNIGLEEFPYMRRSGFMRVEANTQYTINSFNSDSSVAIEKVLFFDASKRAIQTQKLGSGTFITPNNCSYIRVCFKWKDSKQKVMDQSDVDDSQIYLIKGNVIPNNYVQDLSDINKIMLNEPLRGISDKVKDKIVKINNKWFIERKCGEIILDGSENWGLFNKDYSGLSNYQYLVDDIIPQGAKSGYNISISDKFMWGTVSDNPVVEDYEHHRIQGIDNAKRVYLWLDKNTAPTIEELKSWLSSNNVRIVYQLETPTYEPLKIEPTLNLYTDITYISNNSVIPTNMKITVDRTLNRAVEAVELAKTNPTIENLTRARYWTNLLKESTKKDELQEEINNNVDVVDLQLERKIASANLDLYIKCENMLSMSLDTNQISFDNFSGVEDLEKQNAIAISVNSSLPYQLNSYLVSEIQNSDKSKIMDKDILNIRENSESEYKTFNAVNEKLVLKDNIAQGNDNVHNIDLMLKSGLAFEKDIYKATIKLEAEQK